MQRVNRMSLIGAALALTLGATTAMARDGERGERVSDREARHLDHGKHHGAHRGHHHRESYPYPPYPYYAPRVEVAAVPFSPGTMIFVRPDHITVLRPGWD